MSKELDEAYWIAIGAPTFPLKKKRDFEGSGNLRQLALHLVKYLTLTKSVSSNKWKVEVQGFLKNILKEITQKRHTDPKTHQVKIISLFFDEAELNSFLHSAYMEAWTDFYEKLGNNPQDPLWDSTVEDETILNQDLSEHNVFLKIIKTDKGLGLQLQQNKEILVQT